MRHVLALLIVHAAVWAAGPAAASAETCERATLDQSLAASEAVFSGVVAAAQLVGPELDTVRVDIVPTRVFKGESADRYVVHTRRPAEGFEFVAGEHYVVFAHANGRTSPPEIDGLSATALVTTTCTYTTKQFAESSAVVRWLERASRDAR